MESSHEEFEEEEENELGISSEKSLSNDFKQNKKFENFFSESGSANVKYRKTENDSQKINEKLTFIAKSLDKRFGKVKD